MDETQEITAQIIGNENILGQMHTAVTRAFAGFLLSVGSTEGATPEEKLANLLSGLEEASSNAESVLTGFVDVYDETQTLKTQLATSEE